MAKQTKHTRKIYVYADWIGLGGPLLMGVLQAEALRGKEIFSFTYEKEWLKKGQPQVLDPELGLYAGPQYAKEDKNNFGIFLDSSPDRWGRVLMQRREALLAKATERKPQTLLETDYLLGVHDQHRMGAIRFKTDPATTFVHADASMAAPPFTQIRTLEQVSLQLEQDDAVENKQFSTWVQLLLAPGSSLGGARPKASVVDPKTNLWIAKFPSRNDTHDVGGWEAVVNELARRAGIDAAEGIARRFSQEHHSYLSKRFDRQGSERIHFASAMTLLGLMDGEASSHANQVSYLHIAEFIMRHGAQPNTDLVELWRRIVFNICVSNSDDHLRNHGFLLTAKGWRLSPAYDMNPIPRSQGLHLNINEYSNTLDLDLAIEVAPQFRVNEVVQEQIIDKVTEAVSHWHETAVNIGIPRSELLIMESVFKTK